MTLRHLSVNQLRNLKDISIELHPQLNLFYGHNGSGKTSLLEAISCLSLARSFRTQKLRSLIQTETESFTVFGRVNPVDTNTPIPVGVSRTRSGDTQIKVAGNTIDRISDLAVLLPFRVINSQSFLLLEGAPEIRRKMMDWLVFHVEPQFYSCWKIFEKSLKQRNSLLRHDKIDRLSLESWDLGLASQGETLDKLRASTFELLKVEFDQLLKGIPTVERVTLDYYRGWSKDVTFNELLQSTLDRDFDLGYTRQGPQRADIRVKIDGMPAVEVLSRGQQKMVVCALLIAQGQVYSKALSKACSYLIDDLPSELDDQFRQRLAEWLNRMNAQVFVTGVYAQDLLSSWSMVEEDVFDGRLNMFHVEHGVVKPILRDTDG